jgi:hypothetical protein
VYFILQIHRSLNLFFTFLHTLIGLEAIILGLLLLTFIFLRPYIKILESPDLLLELLLMLLDKCLHDDCEDKVEEEELADDNDHEAVDEPEEGRVYVHQVHYLQVPRLTRDHLEHGEQGAAQVLEVSHSEIQIGLVVDKVGGKRERGVVLDVTTS